jgi:hypothetical protein
LAQDRDHLQAVVNVMMNIQVVGHIVRCSYSKNAMVAMLKYKIDTIHSLSKLCPGILWNAVSDNWTDASVLQLAILVSWIIWLHDSLVLYQLF